MIIGKIDRGLRALAGLFIRFYIAVLSVFLGGNCRFYPSCSCYGQTAFEKHSFFTALYLTLRRILKCHPLGSSGYDPVPEATTKGLTS